MPNITREQKEKYLKQLSAEEFKAKVIRPLFEKMGYGSGKNIDRSSQDSASVLFIDKDRLEDIRIIRVIPHLKNINMVKTSKEEVESLIQTVRSAWQENLRLENSNKKVHCDDIIICSTGKINDKAENYIKKQTSGKEPRLFDLQRLIGLVDNHCEEIWKKVSPDVILYYNFLRGNIEQDLKDPLATSVDNEHYIHLNLGRHIAKPKKIDGEIKRVPEYTSIEETELLRQKHPKCIIRGDAGMGKSTILRRLVYQITQYSLQDEGMKPILLLPQDVEVFADADADTFVKKCDAHFKKCMNQPEQVFSQSDFEQGKVVLLADALDEIADDRQEKFIKLLNELSKRYPKVKIICTSRPGQREKKMVRDEGYVRYDVSHISWRQAQKLLSIMKKEGDLPRSIASEVLRRINSIHGLDLTPLLVKVFAATLTYSRQDIPANITELFSKYTELMLGRWDQDKGFEQQYEANLKIFLMKKLAGWMHDNRVSHISEYNFKNIIEEEMKSRGYEIKIEEICTEMLERSGLLKRRGDAILFTHHLLQEFFAGIGISDLDKDEIFKKFGNRWWTRPLMFYFGNRPDAIHRLEQAQEKVSTRKKLDPYEVSLAIGLSLQACYLSEVSTRLDIWKTLINNIAMISTPQDKSKVLFPLFDSMFPYAVLREAVPLSVLKDPWNQEELTEWSKTADEGKFCWFLIALMETGCFEKAHQLIKKTKKWKNSFYPFILYWHSGFLMRVSAISPEQKKTVNLIRTELDKRNGVELMEFRREIVREIDTYFSSPDKSLKNDSK